MFGASCLAFHTCAVYWSMQCMYKANCLPYSLISDLSASNIVFQFLHASSLIISGAAKHGWGIPIDLKLKSE